MNENILELEDFLVTDIFDNINDKDSIRICKRLKKEIYDIEFNHSYNNQKDFDIGIGDFFYRLKIMKYKHTVIYTDFKMIITIDLT